MGVKGVMVELWGGGYGGLYPTLQEGKKSICEGFEDTKWVNK